MAEKGWLNLSGTGNNGVYNASNSGVYGKMWHLINTYDPNTGQFGLANTPEARNAYLQAAEKRNTNWFDELFSLGVMQNHSVSMTAGTDKASYYASLSVMKDPGWYKQSRVNRYTANLNTTVSMAAFVFVLYNVVGIYVWHHHYIKQFLGVSKWLIPLMFPLEIVSHLSRLVSLSLRLFGNIRGEEIVMVLFFVMAPILGTIPIYALFLLGKTMQAFVFFMLTMFYIKGALEAPEH